MEIRESIGPSLRVGLTGAAIAFRSVAILLAFAIGMIAFVEAKDAAKPEAILIVVLIGIIPALIVILDYIYDVKSKVLDPPKDAQAKADNKNDAPGIVCVQRDGVASMLKWEIISIGVLLTLILLSVALLVWLAPTEQMTPAQLVLLWLAGTVVKVSFAGIVVLIGLGWYRRRGGDGGDN